MPVSRAGRQALGLERAGLWRRAAHCWLEEMDVCTDERMRGWLVRRREACLSRARVPTPEQRKGAHWPPPLPPLPGEAI
jgi:hypothetical protein